MTTPILTALCLAILLTLAGRKWELKPPHYLPWSAAMAVLGGLLVVGARRMWPEVPGVPLFVVGVGIPGVVTLLTIAFFFFRDPERASPDAPDKIVSPADGRVVYIKRVEQGRFPFAVKGRHSIPLQEFSSVNLIPDSGWQIGIAMNFLNVHVNRSPIAGTLTMLRAIPGKFASLKHIGSLLENERVLMVTEGQHMKVGIVQIASRLVRRIVPYVKEGDQIAQGQRVGMIRFGSQVDLLIAERDGLQINVAVGDDVVAGETILITCEDSILTSKIVEQGKPD
jgi:phosphatidylserine decarboxylase